jgi:hypothetical protein
MGNVLDVAEGELKTKVELLEQDRTALKEDLTQIKEKIKKLGLKPKPPPPSAPPVTAPPAKPYAKRKYLGTTSSSSD